jgi:hypothetical protein
MPAGRQVETEKGIAGLHQREERSDVGRRARMRLHVRKSGAEQLLDPVDREPLRDIDVLAAAVIATARIALGVFVGQHRALRLQHRAADDVFGRDQFDFVALATEFLADRVEDFGVGFGKRGSEQRFRAGFRGGFSRSHEALQGRPVA